MSNAAFMSAQGSYDRAEPDDGEESTHDCEFLSQCCDIEMIPNCDDICQGCWEHTEFECGICAEEKLEYNKRMLHGGRG